jgi:hypothetical protein
MSTCAISGRIPEEPVVATTTGYVFEHRLILKHLETQNTCPISHTPLSPENLLPLKTSTTVPPRPPTAASFPQLLTTLQQEYDAMLLETFSLRQQLDLVKKDLAKQYYTLDASNRVIARLYKENKELKDQLAGIAPARGAIVSAPHGGTSIGQTGTQYQDFSLQNTTSNGTALIETVVTNARALTSGKALRAPLLKQLIARLPNSQSYINAIVPQNSIIMTSSNTQLLPQHARSQFMSHTMKSIQGEDNIGQYSFIPTNNDTVLVVQNDSQNNSAKTIVTIPLPIQGQKVSITGLTTTNMNTVEFPWIGNLIMNNNNNNNNNNNMADEENDKTIAKLNFLSFIVSTSTMSNQNTISIFACNINLISNPNEWKCLHQIRTTKPLKSIVTHPSQSLLYTLTENNNLDSFSLKLPLHQSDLTSNEYTQPISSIQLPTNETDGYPISLSCHPDQQLIGIGYSKNNHFKLFNIVTNTLGFSSPSPTPNENGVIGINGSVNQIEFSQGATLLVVFTYGQGFTLWNVAKQIPIYQQIDPTLTSICFDQTGKFIVAGGDNNIFIFGLENNEKIATISIQEDVHIRQVIVQHGNKSIIVVDSKKILFVQPR